MNQLRWLPLGLTLGFSGCVVAPEPVAEDYAGYIDLACPDAPSGAFHYARPVRVIAPYTANACGNEDIARRAAVEYIGDSFLDKRCGATKDTVAKALSFSCDVVYPDQQSSSSDSWQLVMTNLATSKSDCEGRAEHACDTESAPVVDVTSYYLELLSGVE